MAVKGKNPGERQCELPVLIEAAGGALVLESDGTASRLAPAQLASQALRMKVVVCNRPLVERRVGCELAAALDILELAAFVLPAVHFVPTIAGLSAVCKIDKKGEGAADRARALRGCLDRLLQKVMQDNFMTRGEADSILRDLAGAGWAWAEHLPEPRGGSRDRQRVGRNLPEWSERSPRAEEADISLKPAEVLASLEGALGPNAESRPDQREYALQVAELLGPRKHRQGPNLAILEAGTGIGKTLGYLAPAVRWSEEARGRVWISTYTKNLQRQMNQELSGIYRDSQKKSAKTTIRKGRENYLCLLNFEEASRAARPTGDRRRRIFLGLVRRWLNATSDGDMVGGDFPRWLALLFPGAYLAGLSDRRGECIFSACDHYRRCFIERSRRKARASRIVIANHAVTLIEASLKPSDPGLPRRYIFDEAHQLFAAADSVFSVHLTGREGLELRRWMLGPERPRRGIPRGLGARLEGLIEEDPEACRFLQSALAAASKLPRRGWLRRLQAAGPVGPFEKFLMQARSHVLARQASQTGQYSLEASLDQVGEPLLEAAAELRRALVAIADPLEGLCSRLQRMLDAEEAERTPADRARLEGIAANVVLRTETLAAGLIPILDSLSGEGRAPASHCDALVLARRDGRELDVGLHRHWIDPTEPLAEAVLAPAASVCVTSATLRDRVRIAEGEEDWSAAEARVGAQHLAVTATRRNFPSPFDYGAQCRVFVVTDVAKGDPDAVAAAIRDLFIAAGGGGLGLFTAIERLRRVQRRIAGDLAERGVDLYAQHVDPLDPGTLVDIFRAEPKSCLLGTDAMRDGIDVPGSSLRIVVFDRVPWPLPDLLHRARREKFGGRAYDEMLVRLRLRQAFGRLVRRASDRGVFVLLDAATPGRMLEALPPAAPVRRVELANAIAATRDFLEPG